MRKTWHMQKKKPTTLQHVDLFKTMLKTEENKFLLLLATHGSNSIYSGAETIEYSD